MRGASSDIQSEPVGEPDPVSVPQPHYRFTRQPVKYYRHHNPGARLSTPCRAVRKPAASARSHPGSADSSRSSSPEPGAQRLSQNLDVSCENTCQQHQPTIAAANKVDVPPNPREVVQYMLGLDSTFTSVAAATPSATTQESSQEAVAGCHSVVNINQSNNKQGAGNSRALCQSPKTLPVEHKLTSPAQKILSGLKLRRSHSGKDEQLFV